MLTISELARNVGFTRQYIQRCVKKGCPLDDFESARLWLQAHRINPQKELKSQISEPDDFEKDPELRDLFKSLNNTAVAAQNAWNLLDQAFTEGRPSKISVMLNLHSKAVEARVKTEKMVQDVLERRGILITLAQAKTSVRRVCEIMVSRLSALPQNIAPRVNPHNPEHAMEILQEECAGIIADAQKASII